MTDPDLRRNDSLGWWLSGILAALLIGVLSGQYLPNRNVVTADQLEEKFQIIASGLEAQRQSIEGLTVEVNDMKGQLKGKKLLEAQ